MRWVFSWYLAQRRLGAQLAADYELKVEKSGKFFYIFYASHCVIINFTFTKID